MTAPKKKSERDTAATHVRPPRGKSGEAWDRRDVERAATEHIKRNKKALTELSKW